MVRDKEKLDILNHVEPPPLASLTGKLKKEFYFFYSEMDVV
jgi:hypothetical protein